MPPIIVDKFSERQLREAVAEKSKALAGLWQQAVVEDAEGRRYDLSRIVGLSGTSQERIEALKARNAELDEYKAELDRRIQASALAQQAQDMDRWANEPVGGIPHPKDGERSPGAGRGIKSIGRLLVESSEYRQFKGLRNWPAQVNVSGYDIRNAVFRTGAGWDPQDIRIARFELSPQRPIAVVDAVPMLPTSESAILYMEETTFTNNAVETAESAATTAADLIGEAALVLTERSRTVEWLPVFIPVTMQQMEDQEGIEEYVNSRLAYMLRARLDSQMLNGNGTTPNILGTANVSGINTQAKGTDPTPDAIYRLFQQIRGGGATPGFAEPSVLFTHPTDWTDVRLLRTADGIYIFGNPTETGPERIWGVPVVQTAAATENTMLAGDYTQFAALYTKRGITLAVSDSHSSYFTRGMLAIRADMRIAMVHFRPRGFGTVTGV